MRRFAAALAVLAAMLLAGPLFASGVAPAAAHAELLSTTPGAGQRLAEAPTALVLVFSERLDPLGTGVDVLDGEGRALLHSAGERAPEDHRVLRVELPPLSDGLYTVAWRSLSADDGHSAQGFFGFAVGEAAAEPMAAPRSGDIHDGHGLLQAILETGARVMAELGTMFAFGLIVVALAIVGPLDRAAGRTLESSAAASLVVAGAGAALLIPLAATWSAVDPLAYALRTQPGLLLLGRLSVGLVLGTASLLLARRWRRASLPVAAAGGSVMVGLLALSGHAAAFSSPAPVVAVAVHVAAAGCWLAGVVVLAWLAVADGGRRRRLLTPAVPRFSALALVSVGLFSLTGAYAWWLVTGQLMDLNSVYGVLLVAKAALAIAALSLGGLNYVGWRVGGPIGIARRVVPEAALGLAVVGVTALLASGSPPGPLRPVPIAEAVTTAQNPIEASLRLLPGRPGANRVYVNVPAEGSPDHAGHGEAAVELVLQRLDAFAETRVEMHPLPAEASTPTYATDVVTPANSRWDASVRLLADGREVGRSRFVFAFDEDGLTAGRALPLVDPLLLVALILAGGGLLAGVFALAGGVPPRTHPATARRALLIGAATAGGVAVVALVTAP